MCVCACVHVCPIVEKIGRHSVHSKGAERKESVERISEFLQPEFLSHTHTHFLSRSLCAHVRMCVCVCVFVCAFSCSSALDSFLPVPQTGMITRLDCCGAHTLSLSAPLCLRFFAPPPVMLPVSSLRYRDAAVQRQEKMNTTRQKEERVSLVRVCFRASHTHTHTHTHTPSSLSPCIRH